MKEKVLISACLIGVNCKYNGENNYDEKLFNKLSNQYDLIPVCPEIMGGLSTPRAASEIVGDKVINKDEVDVTINYFKGAKETLEIAKKFNINKAILKAKSPSCGEGKVYDGTFSGTLTDGDGITTKMLKDNGVEVINLK